MNWMLTIGKGPCNPIHPLTSSIDLQSPSDDKPSDEKSKRKRISLFASDFDSV